MPGQNAEDPIVEVWASNVDEEFKKIRKLVQRYPYVAMVCSVGISCHKLEKMCTSVDRD